jgi:predicted acetyltransferase
MVGEVRPLGPGELRAAHTLFAGTIHHDALDDVEWAAVHATYEPGRSLGVDGHGVLIGTTTSFATRTAVPGGAALDTAAVTRVGVRPDHTRRGVLSAMMRAQLDDIADRGEPLASLRASEARIYGRFGYGVATRGREVSVRAGGDWRGPAGGRVRLVTGSAVVPTLADLHDRVALLRAGGITRPRAMWDRTVGGQLARHRHLIVAVHTGPDGDDGFALAAPVGDGPSFTDRTLRLTDLHAASLDATAGLWRFLLGLDLVGRVDARLRPPDEPLELLLDDPRDCTSGRIEDETWLRIVDVPAALAARSWGDAPPVLVGVHDRLRPGNDGVYRIGHDGAARVAAEPELECDVAALAMAYLGDRAPSLLAATGWWRVHDAAALPRADALFATGSVPWCGTYF